MNHCPVYGTVGGHAYGWVYPGPMGAVLTPVMLGIEKTNSLPNACTLNGRCQEVCPMQIPLPSMLRHLREREYAQNLTPILARAALALWALVAQRPKLYAIATRIAVKALSVFAGRRGRLRCCRLPVPGLTRVICLHRQARLSSKRIANVCRPRARVWADEHRARSRAG
jgi:L-lactate dehydrogenase complex protein LldF